MIKQKFLWICKHYGVCICVALQLTIHEDYEDVWVDSSMMVEFGPVRGVRRIDIAFKRFENSNAGRAKKLTFYTCMTGGYLSI